MDQLRLGKVVEPAIGQGFFVFQGFGLVFGKGMDW